MKTAIIIAFSYQDDNSILSSMSGIKIDLYKIYKYVNEIGMDNIIVITDIMNDPDINEVNNSINLGIVDIDILDIISTIKINNKYIAYEEDIDINNIISRNVVDSNKLLFYYSGHSYNNNFLFPNKIEYDSKEIMDNIRSNMLNGYIFALIDCCRISSLGVPFINSGINNIYIQESKIDNNNIVLFTSGGEDQDSLSYTHGSIFTHCTIKALNKIIKNGLYNTDMNIKKLKIDINQYMNLLRIDFNRLNMHLPNIKLYVSNPNIKSLWPWLFGLNHTLNIKYNYIDYSLTITVI